MEAKAKRMAKEKASEKVYVMGNDSTRQLATVDPGFTEVSWLPSDDMEYDEWESLGLVLQQMGSSLPWWIGDWLNWGELQWGEIYAQAVEITGLTAAQLQNYKWVAGKIDPERRRPDLPWSIHRVVASFDVPAQEKWLTEATQQGYTVAELTRQIQVARLAELPPAVTFEDEQLDEAGERLGMDTVSPVRRLRYALNRLLERHMEMCPFDHDEPAVIQAQNIYQETQHQENEDLNE